MPDITRLRSRSYLKADYFFQKIVAQCKPKRELRLRRRVLHELEQHRRRLCRLRPDHRPHRHLYPARDPLHDARHLLLCEKVSPIWRLREDPGTEETKMKKIKTRFR
jgi:hypothetical protein